MTTSTTITSSYPTNPFYQDLVALMTSPSFQQFSSKYMRSWTDVETVLIYVKLYESLAQYLDAPHDIMAVIDRVMNTDLARKRVIQGFRDFQKGAATTLVLPKAPTPPPLR